MVVQWPAKAASALAFLFRPTQDVDVYVEDIYDTVFYTELIRRIAPKNVRISRVFTEGGRSKVLEKARAHDQQSRPALFLIDGDFEWVRGENPPQARGVLRLDAYCIENLLLVEKAVTQVVVEDAVLEAEDARNALAFDQWLAQIAKQLVGLFIRFSVLNLVAPAEKTVGLGVGRVITESRKGRPPSLDEKKLQQLNSKVEADAVQAIGRDTYDKHIARIQERVEQLPNSHDAVSGKDFLFPLLEYHLAACARVKVPRASLRLRLARHCDPDRFREVTEALGKIARGA